MSVIEVETLLQELPGENPCGEDLEYDEAYLALEQAAKAKPEQQMGDQIIPAEEPRWSDVRDRSLEVLLRTKDLTVVVHLLRAVLRTDGVGGFADGLELTLGLLERYWETIYPDSPIRRMNTLASLCDVGTVLGPLREAPLVESRGLGRFSLKDVELAANPPPAAEGQEAPPSMATIDAAFLDVDIDELKATGEAVDRAFAAGEALDSLISERADAGEAPDFGPLRNALRSIRQTVAERLERRGVGGAPPAEEGGEADDGGDRPEGSAPRAVSGELNSPDDVVRVLDKVIQYFERTEPSSPVPIFIRRAKRLVRKSFIDILRDLAPDAVAQAEHFQGVDSDE